MPGNKQTNENKIHFAVDIMIGLAVLALLSFTLTGLTIHEWLGLGFTVVIFVHLLLNWRWIITTTRRFFAKLTGIVRFKSLVDATLFATMTIVIFSGLMISESALPFLGLKLGQNPVLRGVHSATANITLVLIGLHLASNWKWLITAVRQYVLRSRTGQPLSLPSTVATGSTSPQSE